MEPKEAFDKAVALDRAGRRDEARTLAEALARAYPDEGTIATLAGSIALAQGDVEAGEVHLRRAAEARPDALGCRRLLSESLERRGDLDSALKTRQEMLDLAPSDADVLMATAGLLHQLERPGEAAVILERMAEIHPGHSGGLNLFGVVLEELGEMVRAEDAYLAALAAGGERPEPLFNLGNLMVALGRRTEARRCFRKALAADPDYFEAATHLAMLDLLDGDFDKGWPGYEARKDLETFAPFKRRHAGTPWRGEDVAGKRVVVFAEQGMGDTLHFVRYLPLLAARGAEVLFEAPVPLRPLLESVEGVEALFAFTDPVPEHDLEAALLSLPGLMGGMPAEVPYLRASEGARERWPRQDGGQGGGRPRIGLVWQGNRAHKNDRRRSCGIERAAELVAAVPEGAAHFVCLQREFDPGDPERLPGVAFPGEGFATFDDTAAVIEGLDLVISVDTSVAHLAGALGKPVWILIPFAPDWRWMTAFETTSPWYPTARLYRQGRREDWGEVIARVSADLRDFVGG